MYSCAKVILLNDLGSAALANQLPRAPGQLLAAAEFFFESLPSAFRFGVDNRVDFIADGQWRPAAAPRNGNLSA